MGKDVVVKEETSLAVPSAYKSAVNVGTEEMSQADLNTPVLKVIQPNTQGILGKTDGWFYRNDTKAQMDEVDVNLVYVTTQEIENFNRTGEETAKIYFGFYAGTNEPFKMFCRGWALGAHRAFQTQVARIKGKFKVPMLALTVRLTSEEKQGVIPDSKKPYMVYKPVFTILKNKEGNAPLVEEDPKRIQFLIEAAKRFGEISKGTSKLSERDVEQNESVGDEPDQLPDEPLGKEEEISPEDIPF